jgi:hypothetical protein
VIGSATRIGPCDTATRTITATIVASSPLKTWRTAMRAR